MQCLQYLETIANHVKLLVQQVFKRPPFQKIPKQKLYLSLFVRLVAHQLPPPLGTHLNNSWTNSCTTGRFLGEPVYNNKDHQRMMVDPIFMIVQS